jgi:hypothetical protein
VRIDVARGAAEAYIAMEIAVANVGIELISVEIGIGVPLRASQIVMLVSMRVCMSTAVTVGVEVNCVGVVVVNSPIRVRAISMVLIVPGI